MQALIQGAPILAEHLDGESRAHFASLCALLDAVQIPYTINPRLVRGLDYYSHTVFEWVTDALGAQDAICAGGRYDGLIASWGRGDGGDRLCAGPGAGGRADRAGRCCSGAQPPAVYLIASGARAEAAALPLAEALRDALPGQGVQMNLGGGNYKSQFRRADRSGACLALILGMRNSTAAWWH